MINIKEIKASARDSLDKKLFGTVWLRLLVCALVAGLLSSLPSTISSVFSRISPVLAGLLGMPLVLCSILISGPFEYGLSRMYMRVASGEKNVDIHDIFIGFKENFADAVVLGFLRSLFTFLWSLLFIIPGIVKSYAYSMAFYIQQDAPGQKDWRECMDQSIAMTDGYKGKLFLLDLSFIGWYIVGILCFGIGVLWVSVYHKEARAHFYKELKKIKYGDAETTETEEEKTSLTLEESTDDIYRYDEEETNESLVNDASETEEDSKSSSGEEE